MNQIKNNILPRHLDPGSVEFDLFQSPFYLIAHADFQYHEDLDKAIAKHGLDRTTYRLLTILMRNSPISIKDLSSRALLKRSTASRALGRMSREGWVRHSLNDGDNRVTDIYLTSSGRALAEKVMQIGSRQVQRAVEGLDPSELERLVRNLSKLPIE